MKQYKLVLYFFLFVGVLSSQNSLTELRIKGDSLIKLEDYDKAIELYNKGLALALDNNKNKQAAIFYKKKGLYFHRKKAYVLAEVEYKKGLVLDSLTSTSADLYFNISLIKNIKGEKDSVIHYLQKSVNIFSNSVLTEKTCNTYLYSGIVYKDRQLYNVSLQYLIKAYNGYKFFNNKNKLAETCLVIGNVHNHLHNYNQAMYYYNEAFKFQKKIKNTFGLGRIYINKANTFDNLKQFDSAIYYYKEGINVLPPNSPSYALAKYNLANTYKKIDKKELSEVYFKESILYKKKLKDTISLLYSYNGIINLLIEQKRLSTAKKYLDSICSYAVNVSDKIVVLNYFKNQAEYFNEKDNYIKAYNYLEQYNALYEIIYDAEQTEIVQNLQAKFNFSNKQNEILKLKLANKNNKLELVEKNKSIKSKNLQLFIIMILCVILMVSYYLYRVRQKSIQQGLKIERLEAVYQGQETIKKRIARDLHDIIATNFDGLRLRILALKKSKQKHKHIDDITKELKDVNNQIRIVSHRLSPLQHIIGNKKFTDIIKSRLSEFQLYSKVFVELENEIPDDLNNSTKVFQDNFYGILLEILNNIEKHSKANKLSIDYFIDSNKKINIIFIDNGVGINQESKHGIGLLNIKQRCEILHAKCIIKKVEIGTSVQLIFSAKHIFKNETD